MTGKGLKLLQGIHQARITSYNVCYTKLLRTKDQHVLDIGTGTGALPRNMYMYGAKFIGTDIAENQIAYAQILSKENNMDIDFLISSAEETNFPAQTFDVITACQCHFYFNHAVFAPHAYNILKDHGKLAFLYMAWLPRNNFV